MDAQVAAEAIAQLARDASIELNVQDLKHLQASRALLPPGKRVYISHLPKQSWEDTLIACRQVSEAGFEPIPHVPVRLVRSEAALDRFFERAVRDGHIQEALLIAGDYERLPGRMQQFRMYCARTFSVVTACDACRLRAIRKGIPKYRWRRFGELS